MNYPKLRTMGEAFGLFLSVYVPAFAAVSLIRPPLWTAIPLVVAISLAIALAWIVALTRRTVLSEFGFRIPSSRFAGWAMWLGLPLAVVAGCLVHVFPSKSPIDTSGLPLWMLAVYFVIGASIQEEIIFRGLIQSFLESRLPKGFSVFGVPLSAAVLFAAALFGIVHLESGLAVFASAIALGFVAGELRRRSGSLLPGVIVHGLFNLVALLWP
jgi:membrane protease YdiL (CAAX protease family)